MKSEQDTTLFTAATAGIGGVSAAFGKSPPSPLAARRPGDWHRFGFILLLLASIAQNAVGATLVAQYHLEESSWGSVLDSGGGNHHGTAVGSPLPVPVTTTPALSGATGTCGNGSFSGGSGALTMPGLPVSLVPAAQTSVSFWMYWDGTNSVMPIGWQRHDLWLASGSFGFNTANSDIYGISSAGLAGGWHHVVAIFTNGNVTGNSLYIDGVAQALTQRQSTPNNASAIVDSTLRVSGWGYDTNYKFSGRIDEVKVYNGALTPAEVTTLYGETHACPRGITVMATSLGGIGSFSFTGTNGLPAVATVITTVTPATPNGTSGLTNVPFSVYGAATSITEVTSPPGYALLSAACVDGITGPVAGTTLVGSTLTIPAAAVTATANITCTFVNTLPATLLAEYHLEESSWGSVIDSGGGNHHGTAVGSPLPVPVTTTPALSGATGTCGNGSFAGGSGSLTLPGLPVSLAPGAQTSVSFWMYWNGTNNVMPIGWHLHDLWLVSGSFGFNTANSDIYGISSTGLAGGWHHVVAIFTNGSVTGNSLYIDGVAQTLTQRQSVPNNANAIVNSTLRVSGWGNDTNYKFSGRIDEVKVYSGALTPAEVTTLYGERHFCAGGVAVPFSFNCVEAGANALTGKLYTKLTGTAFSFDVVALRDTNGDTVADAIETTFAADGNKPVTVELVDGAGATACAARAALAPPTSQTLTFTQAGQPLEGGRKSAASMTVAKPYSNLRCRVTDANQAPSVVGCSTDSFSIRPQSLVVASTANADGTGVSVAAVPAVKAGASFSLTATALPGYDGVPTIDAAKLSAHVGAVQVGSLAGGFGAALPGTGAATGNFTYSEVGYFNLAAGGVFDDSFTAIDQASDCTNDFSNTLVGGKYGCKFGNASATSYFGRFIPDHFTAVTPAAFAAACPSGGFTYMDQAFSAALAASIEARNTSDIKTRNYDGIGFGKGVVSAQLENSNSGTPIPAARLAGMGAIVWTGGAYAFTATRFSRPAVGTVDGPFDALAIGVLVTDSDNVYLINRNMDASNISCTADTAGTSDGSCTAVALVPATSVRYGILKLDSAYGSELLPLRVPLRAMYWNTSSWATNTLDACTTLPNQRNNLAIGNHLGTLTAANYGSSKVPSAALTLASGTGTIILAVPAAGTTGSADIALNLTATPTDVSCNPTHPVTISGANLPWLQGNWCGVAGYVRDPGARIKFGSPKAPYIYMRERY